MLLRLLIWLNIIDTLLTISVVGLKWATEANPIMDYFLQQGPLVFGATKLALTLAGTAILWKGAPKTTWPVKKIAAALVVCYALVVTYEAAMILAMVFSGAS